MPRKQRFSMKPVLEDVDLVEVEDDDEDMYSEEYYAGEVEEEKVQEEEDRADYYNKSDGKEKERGLDQSLGGSLSGKQKFEFYSDEKLNFLEDNPKDMTFARRIALKLMKKYEWYNPSLSKKKKDGDKDNTEKSLEEVESESDSTSVQELPDHFRSEYGYPVTHSVVENPSLAKAWAYFEHNTLTRYIDTPKPPSTKPLVVRCLRKLVCKAGKTYDKADPGENHFPTKLYHPIFTPHSQLGDFGLGVGLYFSYLRGLCVLTFLVGLFNMPMMKYYYGGEYSKFQPGVLPMLKGSAICTEQEWVPCIGPNCNNETFPDKRVAYGFMDGEVQMFTHKNLCNGALLRVGLVNLGAVVFVILGMIVLNCYLQNMEISYDEDEQTPQDYSIVISNPPGDATDAEEWRRFFKDQIGVKVTTLTLAVNNDLLVRSLVKRREYMKRIEMKVEPGTSLDMLTLCELSAIYEKSRNIFEAAYAKISPGIPEWFGQIVVLTAKIQGLAQLHYPVTNVFCIFETEADQRKALQKLSVGKYYAERNIKSVLPEKYLFRGEVVLDVQEANEPDTIRWTDLNITFKESIIQKAITLFTTLVAIYIGIEVVSFISNLPGAIGGTAGAAQCISFLNLGFPMFAKWLTRKEAHESETSTQTSLYFKIALFRWVNTALVITIITPFTATLDRDNGIIQQIYSLFYAEIITTTATQVADFGGHFTRHFLAPRAKTQDAMNLCMKGQTIDIAERYTNMTKLFFLTVWYSAIYPAAFFMCSAALFINYFQDRISLMRTWKRAPNLGNHISQFSRKYFLVVCIAVMVVISSFFWSAFPFDDLCETKEVAGNTLVLSGNRSLVGTWNLDIHELVADATEHNKTMIERFSSHKMVDKVVSEEVTLNFSSPTYKYCSQNLLSHNHPQGNYKGQTRFPFWAAQEVEGFRWMTPRQERLTTVYGYASIGVLGLLCVYFIVKFMSDYRDRFRSTYEAQGQDQGINYSDVPSISAYVPEVKSKVYAFPLLATDCSRLSKDLIAWTDPNRAHSFYDLTKDADMLTIKKLQGRRSSIASRKRRFSDGAVNESDDDDDDDNAVRRSSRHMPKLVYSQVAHWPPHRHRKSS